SLRSFNIFGPRQDPSSPYSGVISPFIKTMTQGLRPTIYGEGEQTRDFTYVANVVAANLAAMRHPEPLLGAVFDIRTGRRIRRLAVGASLTRILGTDLHPEFRPAGAADDPDPPSRLRDLTCALQARPSRLTLIADSSDRRRRLTTSRAAHPTPR